MAAKKRRTRGFFSCNRGVNSSALGVPVGAAAAASSSVIMVAAGAPGVGHLPRGQ